MLLYINWMFLIIVSRDAKYLGKLDYGHSGTETLPYLSTIPE